MPAYIRRFIYPEEDWTYVNAEDGPSGTLVLHPPIGYVYTSVFEDVYKWDWTLFLSMSNQLISGIPGHVTGWRHECQLTFVGDPIPVILGAYFVGNGFTWSHFEYYISYDGVQVAVGYGDGDYGRSLFYVRRVGTIIYFIFEISGGETFPELSYDYGSRREPAQVLIKLSDCVVPPLPSVNNARIWEFWWKYPYAGVPGDAQLFNM